MNPRITLSTSCFFPDTRFAFRVAAELGYDGVEIMVSHDRRSQTIESVQALSKEFDVAIGSVHVPCLAISQHVWGWNPELKLRRSVDMAAAVGASVVVVHPPFKWQRDYGVAFHELVNEIHTQHEDIAIAVENMYDVDAFGRRVNPYLWNDDPEMSGFAAVTLDTSHAAAARWDPLDMFQRIDERMAHIHLSDSTGTKGDEHLPPGDGDLPLEKLMSAVNSSKYSGDIVIEVAFQRVPEPHRIDAARDALNWTRDHLTKSER